MLILLILRYIDSILLKVVEKNFEGAQYLTQIFDVTLQNLQNLNDTYVGGKLDLQSAVFEFMDFMQSNIGSFSGNLNFDSFGALVAKFLNTQDGLKNVT